MLKPLFKALGNLTVGSLFGLILFALCVRTNAQLLLKGMALENPNAPPVTVSQYVVHQSDADVFYWQADLIEKPEGKDDRIEARVTYYIDELGFPNQGPIPAKVDGVILGRSFSMGAQAERTWHRILAEQEDLQILNLSQTGSDIYVRQKHLEAYGLPRKPRWVVSEITPALDVIAASPAEKPLLTNLSTAVIFTLYRRMSAGSASPAGGDFLFPIQVELPGRQVELSIYLPYLQALAVDSDTFEDSVEWQAYSAGLEVLFSTIKSNGACPVLLFTPTKSNVYLPLLQDAPQFTPVLEHISTWVLDEQERLVESRIHPDGVAALVENSRRQRAILERFAAEQGALFVDPTDLMIAAVKAGEDPFMSYDTHWSAAGHRIVSRAVYNAVLKAGCP